MIVAKLFVRTALSDFYEAEFLKYPDNLRRFEDWDLAHYLCYCDVLDPDEFRFEFQLAVFEQHRDHFA